MPTNEVSVLLVDDNPDDVSIIRRMLGQYQRARFKVLSAASTGSCLELLEGGCADLLLLDYAMPVEDGLSFLRRASALVDLPPVIMVTGLGDYRLAAEAIRSGASDCISKHAMTSQTLGHSLQQALAKSRQDMELGRFDDNVITAIISSYSQVDDAFDAERLTTIAARLGTALQLNEHQADLLHLGVMLHDVGKLGIRPDILHKQSSLTGDEMEEMHAHAAIGERMCAPLRLARELCPIIRHHHERWDGEGYIDGLAGQDIPFLARIVSVVDAYDAMTTDRPYRTALAKDEAVNRLKEGAGSQWDPEVAAVFLELLKKGTV